MLITTEKTATVVNIYACVFLKTFHNFEKPIIYFE